MFCKALEGSAEIRIILFIQTTRSKEVWIEEIVELKSWTVKKNIPSIGREVPEAPFQGSWANLGGWGICVA